MNFSISDENGIHILKVNLKRATIDYVKEFRELLLDLIETKNIKKSVIDLSEVEFVDSSFLGAVVSGLKKIAANKGDIKISGLQSPVRSMFEITRLYKVFEIFDEIEDALNSF